MGTLLVCLLVHRYCVALIPLELERRKTPCVLVFVIAVVSHHWPTIVYTPPFYQAQVLSHSFIILVIN